MQIAEKIKLTTITGMALFAMFFGAGNMIFPLKLGSVSGQHVIPALIAFLISGVGVPFLGLFAVSLYEGNYWKFFQRFGSTFAFLIITFLILIIGPLFAAPRTEVVTFNTLLPMLPSPLNNTYVFDALYFLAVFILVCNQSRIIDVIGWFLSPVKIIAFTLLVAVGIYTAVPYVTIHESASHVFDSALTTGYGTMDLLGTFFFCAVAYKNIVNKCKQSGLTSQQSITKMTLLSCLVGATLIGLVYTGFIFASAAHADALQNTPTEAILAKISFVILGKYGSLFVGICVTFACLATAAALTEVTGNYFHEFIFRKKISRTLCVLLSLTSMYMMAILGFDGIMKIAVPILNVVYPALIVLCLVNIFFKLAPNYTFGGFRNREVRENA